MTDRVRSRDFLTELAMQRGASPHTIDAYRRDLARLTALAADADPSR
jgi:site-specific recombinase XerC